MADEPTKLPAGTIPEFADEQPRALPAGLTPEFEDEDLPASQSYIQRIVAGTKLDKIIQATGAGLSNGWGDDPVGLDSGGQIETWLRKNGVFLKGEDGMAGPLRAFNEAAIRPTAVGVDALFKSVSAVMQATGKTAGAVMEEYFGYSQGEAARVERDVVGMMEVMPMLAPLNSIGPLYRAARAKGAPSAAGATVDEPVAGGLPKRSDITDAHVAITEGEVVADVKTSPKLQQLYQEKGWHPAEVADDAATDPVVRQGMLSRGDDIPDTYTGANPDKPVPPRVPETQDGPGGGGREPPGGTGAAGAGDDGQRALPGPEEKPKAAWEQMERHLSIDEAEKGVESKATWYEKLVDRLFPLEDEFRKQGLATADDPYRLARLFSGWAAKAQYFIQRGTFGFHTLKDDGVGLRQLTERVAPTVDDPDRLRRFRAYATAVRARELDLKGAVPYKDYSVAEVKQVILDADTGVHSKGDREFAQVFKDLVEYNNRLAAYARDAGMLSRKGYEAMLAANKYYVPWHRVMDPAQLGFTVNRSGLEAKQGFFSVEGSGRQVIDPLESTLRNTAFLIAQAEKNQVGLAIVRAMNAKLVNWGDLKRQPGRQVAVQETSGGRREMLDIQPKGISEETRHIAKFVDDHLPPAEYGDQKIRPKHGGQDRTREDVREVLDQWNIKPEGPNQIVVWENGIPKLYEVGEDIARAMKGLDQEAVGTITKFFGGFADTLRKGALWNPDFWGRHTFRDFFYASLTYKGVGRFTPVDTMRGLYHGILGHMGKSVHFDNWVKSGGGHATIAAMNRRYFQESLYDITGQTGLMTRAQNIVADPNMSVLVKGGKLLGTPFSAISKYVLHPLQVTTELVMEANKLGAYMKRMSELEGTTPPGASTYDAYARAIPTDVQLRAAIGSEVPKSQLPVKMQGDLIIPDGINVTEAMARAREFGIEDGNFTEVFLKASEDKRKMLEAAWVSRETSVDTARIGSKMRAFNMVTAFLNSRVQDAAVMARLFKENPTEATLLATAMITLPSILLYEANKDDSRYRQLPQWQKDLFWIIPTDSWEPATREPLADGSDKDQFMLRGGQLYQNNGNVYRLPKPFSLGLIFASGPERMLEAFRAENPKEAFDRYLGSLKAGIVGDFYPTAVVPVIDQIRNKSTFSGANLIPGPLEKQLPEYQHTIYTTETAKAMARIMSNLPWLRDQALDSRDLATSSGAAAITSPIVIENYIRGWTGTTGMYALQFADTALRKAGLLPDPVGPAKDLADIPFVKAFVIRYPSASIDTVQKFYDMYNRDKRYADTWRAKAREGDMEAMERIRAAGGDQIFAKMDGLKNALTQHQQLIQNIYKNPDLKPEEKRQLIDQNYHGMIAISHYGVKSMRDIRKQLGE